MPQETPQRPAASPPDANVTNPRRGAPAQSVKLPGIITLFIRVVYVLGVLMAMWPFVGLGMDPGDRGHLFRLIVCPLAGLGVAFVGGFIELLCRYIVKRLHDGAPPLGGRTVPLAPVTVAVLVGLLLGGAYLAGRAADRIWGEPDEDEDSPAAIAAGEALSHAGMSVVSSQPATQPAREDPAKKELGILREKEAALAGQLGPSGGKADASLAALRALIEVKRLEMELAGLEESLISAGDIEDSAQRERAIADRQKATAQARTRLLEARAALAALPAGQLAPAKFYHSAAEILAGMPKEAQPDPANGWDEFARPKADKWLEDNVAGHGYEAALGAVVKNVELKQVYPNDHPNETIRWDIELMLEPTVFEFDGRKASLRLDCVPPRNPNSISIFLVRIVVVPGDESLARRAKALKPGDKITVAGTISKAAVRQEDLPELTIILTNQALVLPPSP